MMGLASSRFGAFDRFRVESVGQSNSGDFTLSDAGLSVRSPITGLPTISDAAVRASGFDTGYLPTARW
jgi:hypothetical protein